MTTGTFRKYASLKNLTFVLRADPARLAGLVLLHRHRRRAGTGRARAADRADPANPVHVSGGLSLQMPAAVANHLLVAIYVGICVYSFIYFYFEFERIAIYAQGSYTQQDYIVGLLMFLLVMELSRLAHPVLFWTNVVLVVYTLWGYLSPIDFFWHPGTTLLSRRHVEHGRALDRHLRPLRPARAHPDRGLPAARRRRQRLRGAARHDQRDAASSPAARAR